MGLGVSPWTRSVRAAPRGVYCFLRGPGFEALFEREGRDWKRFYDAARRLADLPKEERHKLLKETGSA